MVAVVLIYSRVRRERWHMLVAQGKVSERAGLFKNSEEQSSRRMERFTGRSSRLSNGLPTSPPPTGARPATVANGSTSLLAGRRRCSRGCVAALLCQNARNWSLTALSAVKSRRTDSGLFCYTAWPVYWVLSKLETASALKGQKLLWWNQKLAWQMLKNQINGFLKSTNIEADFDPFLNIS